MRLVTGPSDPGRIGTPSAATERLASDLFPMSRIADGGGPMKTRPHSWMISAKWALSARNP